MLAFSVLYLSSLLSESLNFDLQGPKYVIVMTILISDLDLTVTVAINLIAFVIFEKHISLARVNY